MALQGFDYRRGIKTLSPLHRFLGNVFLNRDLPIPRGGADDTLCVINLAPDKERVFQGSFRVLKPGGRIMISDIVWLWVIPKALLESVGAYVACLSGAVKKEEYLEAVRSAGFEKVRVVEETHPL
jgi:arsenite methyltransferase